MSRDDENDQKNKPNYDVKKVCYSCRFFLTTHIDGYSKTVCRKYDDSYVNINGYCDDWE